MSQFVRRYAARHAEVLPIMSGSPHCHKHLREKVMIAEKQPSVLLLLPLTIVLSLSLLVPALLARTPLLAFRVPQPVVTPPPVVAPDGLVVTHGNITELRMKAAHSAARKRNVKQVTCAATHTPYATPKRQAGEW
eukprot:IDg15898t1